MDGVEQLNNILIIGMTNRKDMIDEALLRPGIFFFFFFEKLISVIFFFIFFLQIYININFYFLILGRLEVHMEISLPDQHGRVQILNIHTAKVNTYFNMS